MRFNSSVRKIQQTHGVALLVVVVLQAVSLFFVNLFLSYFLSEIKLEFSLRPMVLAFLGSVFVISDIIFIYKKIIRLQPLIHITPVKCKIEDFILIGYTDDGRRRHKAYPIIRSMQDNKLYLSYGDHALSNFNFNAFYINNTIVGFSVYSWNKKELKIGDEVNMYLLKILDVSVVIDQTKNIIRLNGKKLPFFHVNNAIGINAFKDMVFFQGIVVKE
ncbi:MAG: hypothetical protein GX022_09005 [Clostridiaceae bacterium]|nr:hypothetical protein [Clostridiaceae bacterium]